LKDYQNGYENMIIETQKEQLRQAE